MIVRALASTLVSFILITSAPLLAQEAPEAAAEEEALPEPPAPEVVPEAEPEEEEEEEEEPEVRVTVEPGRGFTLSVGDVFSAQLRLRAQFRTTVRVENDEATSGFEMRTARIWWTGNVLDPNLRYGLQLALGANDFEPGNPSPIFDAYVETTHLRELNIRVGQFFVPFDRARTVRESTLMTVDRTDVVRELTLDRDIGIVAQSNDFLGLGGVLTYAVGFWGGDGRNRVTLNDAGFLYTARVSVRPMGAFDDDQESDQTRTPEPHLALGGGFAYNQNTDRPRSTTGTRTVLQYVSARPDYFHLAADAVFKWAGFSFLGEIVWRQANRDQFQYVDAAGAMQTEYSRSGWGYLFQAGMLVWEGLELWVRWEHLNAIGATDPQLITQAADLGHGLSAGANYYINGHFLKIQGDWSHSFGDDFGGGFHLVRLQLDASF